MPVNERDLSIIRKIYQYCVEVEDAHKSFGRSYDAFLDSSVYRNAVSLCILQIGELSNHISDDFKLEHSAVPWREIRGMRNVVAHEYGSIDADIMWETATENLTQIKEFCEQIMKM